MILYINTGLGTNLCMIRKVGLEAARVSLGMDWHGLSALAPLDGSFDLIVYILGQVGRHVRWNL